MSIAEGVEQLKWLDIDEELRQTPPNERPRSDYCLPTKVTALVERNREGVRERFGKGTRNGCPFYRDGEGERGCLLLNDPVCYLLRGTPKHPRVGKPERCMPFIGAALGILGYGYYPEPQFFHLRQSWNPIGTRREDVLKRYEIRTGISVQNEREGRAPSRVGPW